jgi:hypothetical protein
MDGDEIRPPPRVTAMRADDYQSAGGRARTPAMNVVHKKQLDDVICSQHTKTNERMKQEEEKSLASQQPWTIIDYRLHMLYNK